MMIKNSNQGLYEVFKLDFIQHGLNGLDGFYRSCTPITRVFNAYDLRKSVQSVLNKVLFFLFFGLLILPINSHAQTVTPAIIDQLKAAAKTVSDIEAKSIPANSYFIRFTELTRLYNPDFPNTRNKVAVENFKKNGAEITYIGKSVSTFRASVPIAKHLENRVEAFYCVMGRDGKIALIEYEVETKGDQLEVTGKLYQCF